MTTIGSMIARKTLSAPTETSALRVSLTVSLYSGANVAPASGPYVDHPRM
jgi:hypothetical protein